MKQKERAEIQLLVSDWRFKAKSCEAMARDELPKSSERAHYTVQADTLKLCAAELARLLK